MNNELFTVKPSLSQYYGRTVTKDMEFDEKTENGEIHQTLKDLVLTTEIKRYRENTVKGTAVLRGTRTDKKQRSGRKLQREGKKRPGIQSRPK